MERHGGRFAVVLLPMLFIVAQKETGSALVYISFFLMFYREGMTGSVLFTGVAMVIYFVVGIRYEEALMFDTTTSIGKFAVLLLVQIFTSGMVYVYCKDKQQALTILVYSVGITLLALLFAVFVIPFDIVWVQLAVSAGLVGYLVYLWMNRRIKHYLYILLFTIGSIASSIRPTMCSTISWSPTRGTYQRSAWPRRRPCRSGIQRPPERDSHRLGRT